MAAYVNPRLDLALASLEGLSVGDAFGERFFSPQSADWIAGRQLPPEPWRWTDDTHMAISVVEVLKEFGYIDQDALAGRFAERFVQDRQRGYGVGAYQLLERLADGEDWREISPQLFGGGSYGNGAAMRVAPVGAYFSGDQGRAAEEARRSAVITHAHLEGQAGAQAVAVAACLAALEHSPSGTEFLAETARYLPDCLTRQKLEAARGIHRDALEEAVARLGTGQAISAQDTVPFCLWVAAYHLEDYEAALWRTVSGLGDRDTTCAIVGGIVALSAGNIPPEWLRRREPLPEV